MMMPAQAPIAGLFEADRNVSNGPEAEASHALATLGAGVFRSQMRPKVIAIKKNTTSPMATILKM
jgi:hypothetical protein